MKRITILAIFALAGCSSGVHVVFEQRSVVGVTSATLGDYTVPVISFAEGPSAAIVQSSRVGSVVEFSGTATITNKISALGIYSSEEQKSFAFDVVSRCVATNTPLQELSSDKR